MSADIGTDLLCEELIQRRHAATQIYLQGDILPIVKHLAFAGRFRRIDLQPIVQRIRKKQSRMFDFGIWMYRPREANIIADYLAGEASKAAYDLPHSQTQPLEIDIPAPYNVAMRGGAIVLEERAYCRKSQVLLPSRFDVSLCKQTIRNTCETLNPI